MFRDVSLKIKMPVYLSAVLATVIILLCWAAYREVRRAQLHGASQRLHHAASTLANLTASSLDARLAQASALARDASVVDLLRQPDAPDVRPAAVAVVERAVEAAQFVTVEVRDSDGDRALLIGDSTLIDPVYAPPLGMEAVAGPLVALPGGMAYAVSAGVEQAGEVVGTTTVWLPVRVDSAGRPLFSDLVGADGGIYVGGGEGTWTDLVTEIPAPLVPAESASDSGEGLIEYDREGVGRVFAAVEPIDHAPWYVVVGSSEAEVLAGARAFLFDLALLAPIALLIVAVSAWVLSWTITRSVRETASAAEAIATGETGRRVVVRGGDEVGRLGSSFNTMAQRVEESQEALRDLNASLETMLDGAPLPIIALDIVGNVRMWNRASARIFGWSADEVLGHPNPLVEESGAAVEIGGSFDGGGMGRECRSFRKDGRAIDLFIARAPTYSASGRVDGHMLMCEDITARKEAERKLARYAADLSRSNAELENFAHVASHDLREPVRMVRSFTQLLADRYSGQLDEDADTYIRFAVDGADRIEALIKALLEYSRLEGGGGDPSPTPAEEVLDQALTILTPSIEETGAVVTHEPLPIVMADPAQLLRVFQNLIGNAMKFHGDAPPRVHVSAVRDGDRHIISVRDEGIGIAPEHFDRIFVIFKRLHGPQEFGGTGMGLSICKKIIEQHGGRIWVESTPGAGSTFHFSLPGRSALVADAPRKVLAAR
jgi:PAS domain S-box-containing protein